MELLGKPVAEKIYGEIKDKLKTKKPVLAVILIGSDPSSIKYVQMKQKTAQELGIGFEFFKFGENTQQDEIIAKINNLNNDQKISGIIIQLPLPNNFDLVKIIKTISPKKDVDGLNEERPGATAEAIIELMDYYNIDYKNKRVVIVGNGKLVGKPLAKYLKEIGNEPFVCDSKTENMQAAIQKGEIVVTATGVPNLIKPEMISKDTIVIDAGTAEENGKIKGDIDDSIKSIVSAYTPTPGGIGPVTVAKLMKNTVEAAE